MLVVTLLFTICSTVITGLDGCEEGEVTMRGTCQQAEAWVERGLRSTQRAFFSSCTVRQQ